MTDEHPVRHKQIDEQIILVEPNSPIHVVKPVQKPKSLHDLKTLAHQPPVGAAREDAVTMVSQTTDGGEAIQLYRITVAATLYEQNGAGELLEFEFGIPGLPDPKRMKRALYYFDIALFMQGLHRQKLLEKKFAETRTGRMYAAMVDAYRHIDALTGKKDGDLRMYIVAAEKMLEPPLISSALPIVRRLYVAPDPIAYDLRHCISCLRVEELDSNATGPFTCSQCARSSRTMSSN